MQLYFIRHGSRKRHVDESDAEQQLSVEGQQEVARLADYLHEIGVQPSRYFASRFAHATETATILSDRLSPGSLISQLRCLTPKEESEGVEAFTKEAGVLEEKDVVIVVGHEPRLGQLIAEITGCNHSQIARAGILRVSVPRPEDLTEGKGETIGRWPFDAGPRSDLTGKLTSKMQVSGLLAGLTFTTLTVMLAATPVSDARRLSILLLSIATGLFIASLYIYDRLMMPEAFWSSSEGKSRAKPIGWKQHRSDCRDTGVRFAEMVWTWKYVFTPAVVFAALGYIASLSGIGNVLPAGVCSRLPGFTCNWSFAALTAVVLVAVAIWYAWSRPRLAVD